MIKNGSFWKKIAYLGGIAALFVPISQLSMPATTRSDGGTMSKMRKELQLSPAELGKIDPAGAAMSLATLGMRGIASNLLWGRAQHYYKTENYDASKAAVNQITKLQPNFVSVWQFLAWQLSYNVSVEFDDFRHRYHWVKKGINYLIEGNSYNASDPLLLWDTGWFFGHKMGRADEHRQFRRLFRDDADFHAQLPIDMNEARGPDDKPDNWKVAHEWFTRATLAVDSGARLKRLSMKYEMDGKQIFDKKNTPIGGKNPLIFYSDPPKALINYGDAISKEGYLDERTLLAWQRAAAAWNEYGNRPIVTTYGYTIQLSKLGEMLSEVTAAKQRLEELAPGGRERIKQKKYDSLTDAEKAVLAKKPSEIQQEEIETHNSALTKSEILPKDFVDEVPEQDREEARKLAARATELDDKIRTLESYRDIANYAYWETRCQAEQETTTLAARKAVYDALEAYKQTDLILAKSKFEEGWDLWAQVFDRYPVLINDVEGEDVVEAVQKYKKVLDQSDLPYPPPGFKLMKLIEAHKSEYPDIAPPGSFEETNGAIPSDATDAPAATEPPTSPENVSAEGQPDPADTAAQPEQPES